jgi:hypothetical protein
MRAKRPRSWHAPGLRTCGRDARAPRDAQDCAYAGETPALLARAGVAHVRAGRPRTQGRAGLRVCGRGRPRTRHAQDCAYAGGTPAHPGCTWFSVPGSWFLVLGSGRPRSWYAPGSRTCGRDARAPRDAQDCAYAGETPAHPGGTWFSVLGSWFSVRDARTPRMHVVLGSWFLVPGSWFGTPALPGGTWFSVITGMVRDWCQAGSRVIGSVILRTLCPFIPLLSSVEFLGEMSDVLHSRTPLPLIPPTPFSHKGRRGSLSVLMAETGDGTQGLAKKLSL